MNPILIMMVGRSGSSMIAGIFHEHGVWVGPSRPGDGNNQKGYFENLELKKAVREYGMCFFEEAEFKPGWKEKVESIIRSQGYEGGPWLFKHGAAFHKVWGEFKPKIVKVWRNPDDIFKSYRRSGFMNNYSDDEVKKSIKFHHYIMQNMQGFNVYCDAVVKGDYTSLEIAIKGCGLEYNEQIVKDFIVPEWYAQN